MAIGELARLALTQTFPVAEPILLHEQTPAAHTSCVHPQSEAEGQLGFTHFVILGLGPLTSHKPFAASDPVQFTSWADNPAGHVLPNAEPLFMQPHTMFAQG
jgi:hypothetical protein